VPVKNKQYIHRIAGAALLALFLLMHVVKFTHAHGESSGCADEFAKHEKATLKKKQSPCAICDFHLSKAIINDPVVISQQQWISSPVLALHYKGIVLPGIHNHTDSRGPPSFVVYTV